MILLQSNNGLSQSNRADWDSYIAWSIAVITVKQNETSQSPRTNRMKITVRVNLQHQSQSETSQSSRTNRMKITVRVDLQHQSQSETSQSSQTNRMKIAVRVDLQHQSQSETSQPEGSTALAVKQMQTITRGTYCPHTSTTSQ